jgi:5-methylcytosine-specific restriction endonuclease McrA
MKQERHKNRMTKAQIYRRYDLGEKGRARRERWGKSVKGRATRLASAKRYQATHPNHDKKPCPRCGKLKDVKATVCHTCRTADRQAPDGQNQAKRRERDKARSKNPTRRAKQAEWLRMYRQTQTSKDYHRLYNQEYRLTHVDMFKEVKRIYAATNKGIAHRRAYSAKRRAMMVTETISERAAVKKFYLDAQILPGIRCFHCGKSTRKKDRHLDHIMPLAKGGKHAVGNLAVSCGKCNMSKGAKLPVKVGILPLEL